MNLFARYSPWLEKYHAKKITDAELTGIFLLLCAAQKSSRWYGGRQSGVQPQTSVSEIFLKDFLTADSLPDKISHLTLHDFYAGHLLRGVPLRALLALKNWLGDPKYPLELRFEVPTAYDMLVLHARGRRASWLPDCAEKTTSLIENKTPFDFVVHDLNHAYEFFERDTFTEQVSWYGEVFHAWQNGVFDFHLRHSPAFRSQFEYLIADMNSHPEHLKATLKAILPFEMIAQDTDFKM